MRNVICLFLLCACVLVADDADYTAGMSNGRGWRKFPNDMKIAYVAGIYDAGKVQGLVCKEAAFLGGITTGQTVQALDGFFADPLNVSITVIGAMRYLERKAQGASEADLNTMKGELRGK
jgi:hypothetical protein